MNLEQLKAKLESKQAELGVLVSNINAESPESMEALSTLKSEVEMLTKSVNDITAAQSLSLPVNKAVCEVKSEAIDIQSLTRTGHLTLDSKHIFGKELPSQYDYVFKTTVTTSTASPQASHTGIYFPGAQTGGRFVDFMPKFSIASSNEVYLNVTTLTNNASTMSEGSAPSESALGLTPVTIGAKPVINVLPVSESVILSNPEALFAFIQKQARVYLTKAIDAEVISGSNLRSLSALSGIATGAVATGTGSASSLKLYRSALVSGRAKLKAYGCDANALLIHPDDYASLLNQVDSNYKYTNETLSLENFLKNWSIIEDGNCTQGTAYVLDMNFIELAVLKDFMFDLLYDGTDASKGQRTLRAMAICNTIIRPEAVCKITGF